MADNLEKARKVKLLKRKTKGIYQVKKIMNEELKLTAKQKESWEVVEKILDNEKAKTESNIRKILK